VNFAALKIYYW